MDQSIQGEIKNRVKHNSANILLIKGQLISVERIEN